MWSAGFSLFAFLGVWFLLSWRPVHGVMPLVFLLGMIAAFGALGYSAYKRARQNYRDATNGMIVMTDDALVYPDGKATRMLALKDIQDVSLKILRIQGVAHPEIIVETVSGERIIIVEGSQYGEPGQIVSVIRGRIGLSSQTAMAYAKR